MVNVELDLGNETIRPLAKPSIVLGDVAAAINAVCSEKLGRAVHHVLRNLAEADNDIQLLRGEVDHLAQVVRHGCDIRGNFVFPADVAEDRNHRGDIEAAVGLVGLSQDVCPNGEFGRNLVVDARLP